MHSPRVNLWSICNNELFRGRFRNFADYLLRSESGSGEHRAQEGQQRPYKSQRQISTFFAASPPIEEFALLPRRRREGARNIQKYLHRLHDSWLQVFNPANSYLTSTKTMACKCCCNILLFVLGLRKTAWKENMTCLFRYIIMRILIHSYDTYAIGLLLLSPSGIRDILVRPMISQVISNVQCIVSTAITIGNQIHYILYV